MPRWADIAGVSQVLLGFLAPEPRVLETVFLHIHVVFDLDDTREGCMLGDRAIL
jgi:hypothetical protein